MKAGKVPFFKNAFLINFSGTTQDITTEIERDEEKTMAISQVQDNIPRTKSDKTPYTSDIPTHKSPGVETKAESAIQNIADQQLPIVPKNTYITTSNETQLPQNTSSIYDKADVTAVTSQHIMELPTSKGKSIENRCPPKDLNYEAISTNNQTPAALNTLAKRVLIVEGPDTVLTSQQTNGVSQSTLAQTMHAASNIATKQSKNPTQRKNPIPQCTNIAVERGSTTVPNDSLLKETNNSPPQKGLGLASQHGIASSQMAALECQIRSTPSRMPISEGKTTMLRGMPEKILGSKLQEKRTPLLAVVKPSSAGTLIENIGNESSVTGSQPRRSDFQTTAVDNNLTSEATNSQSNLTNVSITQNSNFTSSETRPHILSQTGPQVPSQRGSQTLPLIFTSSKTRAKSVAEMSEANPKDNQNSERAIAMQPGFASKPNISDQEMIKPTSESRVLRSRATKSLDPNQTLSSKRPATKTSALTQSLEKPLEQRGESDPLSAKSNFKEDSQNESKQESKSTSEDFCFSDEEDQSIPRAIGSQVDRIETFLKNERLRLSKKRKAIDQ